MTATVTTNSATLFLMRFLHHRDYTIFKQVGDHPQPPTNAYQTDTVVNMSVLWRFLARPPILGSVRAKVPAALVSAALMATLLVGCEGTTPVSVAHVVSRTFTLKAEDFDTRLNPDRQNAVAVATYAMPEITEPVVAAGTVIAEIDLGTEGTQWSALPLTYHFSDDSDERHVVAIQPGYRKGTFMLTLRAASTSMIDSVLAVSGFRLRATAIYEDAADG